MKRSPRLPRSDGVGVVGSVLVHGMATVFLFGGATRQTPSPPVYRVELVAAPEPVPGERKAPDAVQRPADAAVPVAKPKPTPKSTVAHAAPPPVADATPREAAPRTTAPVAPLAGEAPSTGRDRLTVSTEGMDFPFPEYLQNVVTQMGQRWERPYDGSALDAEVSFMIHRDGSVTGLQFVRRSGSFAYDLEAQGAVEAASRVKAFGPLPDGWDSDVLFVRFCFCAERR
ncbi:MAG TPA: TonB C-terminal domain-containing protein [Gemmatimonadales bacterium]|nr:TonB C-terminal domain-containing protein [Gemmatimonadales bacterium]